MKFAIAINSADVIRGMALNIELGVDVTVPEWIQLLPAGANVQGRDGRA